jgi:hypothetical protein
MCISGVLGSAFETAIMGLGDPTGREMALTIFFIVTCSGDKATS